MFKGLREIIDVFFKFLYQFKVVTLALVVELLCSLCICVMGEISEVEGCKVLRKTFMLPPWCFL